MIRTVCAVVYRKARDRRGRNSRRRRSHGKFHIHHIRSGIEFYRFLVGYKGHRSIARSNRLFRIIAYFYRTAYHGIPFHILASVYRKVIEREVSVGSHREIYSAGKVYVYNGAALDDFVSGIRFLYALHLNFERIRAVVVGKSKSHRIAAGENLFRVVYNFITFLQIGNYRVLRRLERRAVDRVETVGHKIEVFRGIFVSIRIVGVYRFVGNEETALNVCAVFQV